MQHGCITTCDPWGVHPSVPLLSTHLRDRQGFRTYFVGKWDLGHFAPGYWPAQRGFETSFHLNCYGYQEYSTHLNDGYYDIHSGADNWPDKTTYATWMFGKDTCTPLSCL